MTAKTPARPTPERLALAERAAELRRQGLFYREIADRLDVSRSYAAELVADPTGEKARARKDSYAGRCDTCGATTTGSDGRDAAPTECASCAAIRQHEERYWTAGRIIETFRVFAAEHGRSPAVIDAMGSPPSFDRILSPERLAEIDANRIPLPSPGTVQREFGSWDGALSAAGLARNHVGHRGHRTPFYRTRARREIALLLAERPRTIAELATTLRRRRDTVAHTLLDMRKHGLAEQATPSRPRGKGNGRGMAPATWQLTAEGERRLLA